MNTPPRPALHGSNRTWLRAGASLGRSAFLRYCVATLLLLLMLAMGGVTVASRTSLAIDPSATYVVYLHYDYMVASDHTDAPDPAQIQKVVDAYAKHGVALVIDPYHAAIPERQVIAFHTTTDLSCTGPDAVDFFALKQQYFSQTHPVEHYAIFGWLSGTSLPDASCGRDDLGDTPILGQTGAGEIAGTNFVVSLGDMRRLGFTGDQLHFFEATTFMHELGHNLGLRHGGDENTNYKPNYLSVMNYQYQLSGIVQADSIGSNVPDFARSRLDYSSQVLPVGGNTPGALDSADLSEPAGLGSGTADIFAFTDGACAFQPAASTGPVDWDGDGVASNPHARIDDLTPLAHPLTACAGLFRQFLHGFDDWSAIRAYLLAAATCPNSGSDEVQFESPTMLDAHGKPHLAAAPLPQHAKQQSSAKRVQEHAPLITGIAPNPVAMGATITITGKQLCMASVVTLTGGLTLHAQSQPDGSVTAQLPAQQATPSAESGPIKLQAFNGAVTSEQNLLIFPAITSLSTSAAPVGATITIRGAALLQPPGVTTPTTVTFGAGCVVDSTGQADGSLQVVVPVCAPAPGGPLTVTTTVGSATSGSNLRLLPDITTFTPAVALIGDAITITGAHLADSTSATGAPTVSFANCPTPVSAIVNADGSLQVVAPACPGSGPIRVTSALGTAQSAERLTIVPLLVTGFAPASAPVGATLVISFRSAFPVGSIASVTLTGNVNGLILTQTATSVTVLIPSGAQSGVVTLGIVGNGTMTSDQALTVLPASASVTITGISPVSGPVGTAVTITGRQLVSATGQQVTFSGCAAGADAVANADGSVTVSVPPCATTGPLTLTNGSGSATSAQSFTVTP